MNLFFLHFHCFTQHKINLHNFTLNLHISYYTLTFAWSVNKFHYVGKLTQSVSPKPFTCIKLV
jgi:hypothetical protein